MAVMTQAHAELEPQRLTDRVAEEVRAWRGRLRLSQADVGRILGLSQPQISERMRGRKSFSLSEIESLADAFGITPAELLGYAPQEQAPRPRARAIGGGHLFVAPAEGLEPSTCRLTADHALTCEDTDPGCLPRVA